MFGLIIITTAFVTVLFIFILNIVNCFLEYGSDYGHIR